MKYKILITNDDSISSPLLKPLVEVLKDYANEMIIVCPSENKSACSHSINISNPLSIYSHDDLIKGVKTYSISGSPADCVKIALTVFKYDFDIVVSGINDGYNLADDVCYSGTVSAALEAEFYDKLGIAVSILRHDLNGLNYLKKAFDYIFENNMFTKANILNVNIPPVVKGVKETVQGKRSFNFTFVKGENGKYYSIKKHAIDENEPLHLVRKIEEKADFKAVEEGFISISPFTTDKTK